MGNTIYVTTDAFSSNLSKSLLIKFPVFILLALTFLLVSLSFGMSYPP